MPGAHAGRAGMQRQTDAEPSVVGRRAKLDQPQARVGVHRRQHPVEHERLGQLVVLDAFGGALKCAQLRVAAQRVEQRAQRHITHAAMVKSRCVSVSAATSAPSAAATCCALSMTLQVIISSKRKLGCPVSAAISAAPAAGMVQASK
jgi:hypothetical protein